MRLLRLAPVALALTLAGCTCANTVEDTRFACQVTSDCLQGFVCRGGECRPDEIPEGSCFPGERQACENAACERPCGPDGGWASCEPATGAGFGSNPLNCGDCGRRCSDRLGDALTCIDGRCTCVTSFDCPSGDVCLPGGVCGPNTDLCAGVRCAAGEVCRMGACAPVACSEGCARGEVCDDITSMCRPIKACRFAEPCGDGGICEGSPQPDGEPCDDGNACSYADSCMAGACVGTSYSCPAPDQCQQSLACAGDGGCVATPVTDGTPCDDAQSCTAADQCVSGVCTGTAYTCTPDVCAATSECAGDGGCVVTPRNVGASCDDGQACTFGDSCGDAGLCEGTTYSCPGVTECKQAGVCLGDGGCDVVNKPDDTPCDDGLACSANDVCTNGVCGGTPTTTYLDSDGDGRGDLTQTSTACPAGANYVADGGDCDDTNAFVRDTMPAALDADRDGVTATTTLNDLACVGSSTTINGRTYYRSASGAYTWLATASTMADCNDSDDDVFQSLPMLVLDADRDGYSTGSANTFCVGATSVINGRTYYANQFGSFVYLAAGSALGTDCLDSDADVFTTRSVALDADNDGLTATTSTSPQCVGAASTISGRTYYENTAGTAVWLAMASSAADCNDSNPSITGPTNYYADGDGDGFGAGSAIPRCAPASGEVTNNTDCDDSNGSLFTNRSNVVPDDDRDGYPASVNDSTQCAGATSTVSGRTYYADGTGGYWMNRTDCIQRQGANCSASFVDCYDLNGSARYTQTAYFTTDRGDGSFDYNCSGTITANSSSSYCASTTGGVTLYTDATCATASGTGTICVSPTTFALPAACGRTVAGAGTFTMGSACQADTLASTTVIGCR